MNYKAFVQGVALNVLIGLHEWERVKPQPVVMDIEYLVNSPNVAKSDAITDTINYQAMVDQLKQVAEQTSFRLIETLAAHLLHEVETHFDVRWVRIRLAKTSVIECAQACGVEVERSYE